MKNPETSYDNPAPHVSAKPAISKLVGKIIVPIFHSPFPQQDAIQLGGNSQLSASPWVEKEKCGS